jgi:hypothetical protein
VARSAVDVWSISADLDGDGCRILATGAAPLAVSTVAASVTDRGSSVAEGHASIVPAGDSPAGASLHQGRWRFEALLPGPGASQAGAPGTLRLELAWHDPSDGTSSELSIPIGPCRAS